MRQMTLSVSLILRIWVARVLRPIIKNGQRTKWGRGGPIKVKLQKKTVMTRNHSLRKEASVLLFEARWCVHIHTYAFSSYSTYTRILPIIYSLRMWLLFQPARIEDEDPEYRSDFWTHKDSRSGESLLLTADLWYRTQPVKRNCWTGPLWNQVSDLETSKSTITNDTIAYLVTTSDMMRCHGRWLLETAGHIGSIASWRFSLTKLRATCLNSPLNPTQASAFLKFLEIHRAERCLASWMHSRHAICLKYI